MRTASLSFVVAAALGFLGEVHAQGKSPASQCTEAVKQSRMVCLSGNDCQKEISQILKSCTAPQPACKEARTELVARCGKQSKWQGTRECEDAIEQVRHYCAR